MRVRKILLIPFFVIFCTGCQAMMYGTVRDLDKLRLGMSRNDVEATIGRPMTTLADGDRGEEVLVYRKMLHPITMWPRNYAVVLRDGRVVKWGEQHPTTDVNVY